MRYYEIIQFRPGRPPRKIAGPIGTLRDANAARALKIRQYAERCGIGYRMALDSLRLGDGDYEIVRRQF